MRICDADGCGSPVGDKGARGYCPKHYKRLRRGVPVDFDFQAPAEVRFNRYVQRGADDECWPWTGGKGRDGYGVFMPSTAEGTRGAHRVAWSLANSTPVPDGMLVCHTCDNPPCVNPAHLFLGTVTDNNRDKSNKGRHRGNETGNLGDLRRRLTGEEIAEIRAAGAPRYGDKAALARRYGCSGEHVRRILNGTRRETP